MAICCQRASPPGEQPCWPGTGSQTPSLQTVRKERLLSQPQLLSQLLQPPEASLMSSHCSSFSFLRHSGCPHPPLAVKSPPRRAGLPVRSTGLASLSQCTVRRGPTAPMPPEITSRTQTWHKNVSHSWEVIRFDCLLLARVLLSLFSCLSGSGSPSPRAPTWASLWRVEGAQGV